MVRRVFPIPEAIDGQRWDVQPGRPMTSTDTRTMFVPTGTDPVSQFCRTHELGHAKITPKTPPERVSKKHKVSVESLQYCEDYRVHRFLCSLGIPLAGSLVPEEARLHAPRLLANPDELICWAIASAKTGSMDVLREAIDAEIGTMQDEAQRSQARKMLGCINVMAAKVMEKIDGAKKFTPRGFVKRTVPAAQLLDQYRELLRRINDIPDEKAPEGDKWGNGKAQCHGAGTAWCRMETAVAKLGTPRASGKAPRRRWSDEGSVPVAMHRWATDQRLFRVKRRMQGGTLLLDASGSMHFDADDIARIVQQAPGATVAMYSGDRHKGKGQLTIIARNGMAASAREIDRIRGEVGGHNAVDGPALEWLANQPEPRVWMSDLDVNGAPQGFDEKAGLAQCKAICSRANIAVARDIERATEHFAGR